MTALRHLGITVLATVVAGCTAGRAARQGPLPIVVAASESLPAVPDADLTVEMLPEGQVDFRSFSDDMVAGSVIVRSLFATSTGLGYVATYETLTGEQCFGVATRDSTRGQCGIEEDRFATLMGGFGAGDVLVEYAGILGPADVEVYEIELEDGFVVAIDAWDGAGYANWIRHGPPVSITAHSADGTSENVDF